MELRMRSCVRGYHGYQRVWEAVVGEKLECERETRNAKVRNAVVVKKAEKIICCNKIFACLIFAVSFNCENFQNDGMSLAQVLT